MICRYDQLQQYPAVFLKMTGLQLNEFDLLLPDMVARLSVANWKRLQGPERHRMPRAGRQASLARTDQFLLTLIWLQWYPTRSVLGYLFGVSASTVSRILAQVLPLLEAAGNDVLRMPDPGRKRHKTLDALLMEMPDLAIIIDAYEQRVQRPGDRQTADGYYSGTKKQHTPQSQPALNEDAAEICDVSDSRPSPTADLTTLQLSGPLDGLPEGVDVIGEQAYIGIGEIHPQQPGATPHRKPHGKDRLAIDSARWMWPAIILVSAAAAGYLALGQVNSVLRPIVTLWFLLVCPGMAFVRLLGLRERMAELTLAVALSIALNTLLAGVMLYAGMWAPYTGLLIIICLSVGGAITQVVVASFQKTDPQRLVAYVVFTGGVMVALFALVQPFVPTPAPFEALPARGEASSQSATPEASVRPPQTNALDASPTTHLSRTALDGTMIFLLIALLIQKEIARVIDSPQSRQWMQALNVAIVPLLFMFSFIIAIRLLSLMQIV